ncbi:MAG: molybdopterin-binding protein [Symbiobacteriia bacterium]
MLREVRTEDAIGLALAHDVTRIVPGVSKGVLFRRGHVIRPEDVPALLDCGKEHVYILEAGPGEVHEEDAAIRLSRAIAAGGCDFSTPAEGRVNLLSQHDGLLVVDTLLVDRLNEVEYVIVSTRPDRAVVRQGEVVAATRVVPLVVPEATVAAAEALAARGQAVAVRPFAQATVGIVSTGSEVYKGRVPDAFGPVLRTKLEAFGASVKGQVFTADEPDQTAAAIGRFLAENVDLILVTGGMSVDPDDRTPGAIKRSGARIITHGVPVLPGSMFLFGYLPSTAATGREIPVMGLPGAVIYEKTTVFDLILPRVLAGDRLERADFTHLGVGGLLPR